MSAEEEPSVEEVLASLTGGFENLTDSHRELVETVEAQGELLGKLLDVVAEGDGEGVTAEDLKEVYLSGVKRGAEEGAEATAKRVAEADLPSLDASGEPKETPGFY